MQSKLVGDLHSSRIAMMSASWVNPTVISLLRTLSLNGHINRDIVALFSVLIRSHRLREPFIVWHGYIAFFSLPYDR